MDGARSRKTSVTLVSFVQRPAPRPKMASSAPSRSSWRRSSRPRGFGRAKARVRRCAWGPRSRAAGGRAEDIVPSPETGRKESAPNLMGNGSGPEEAEEEEEEEARDGEGRLRGWF